MQGFIAAGDFQTSTHNLDDYESPKKRKRYKHCDWALRKLFTDPYKKERMRQFSIFFQETQTARESHYIKIRNRRAERRKQKSHYFGKIPYLYLPCTLLTILGCIFLFLSVFPGIGESTFLKQQKIISVIASSSLIVIGLVILLITEGLKSRELKKNAEALAIDEDAVDMWKRRAAIAQIPCPHMEPLQQLFFQNGEKPLTERQINEAFESYSHVTMVTTETQTDEEPFIEYLEEMARSFRKPMVVRLASGGSENPSLSSHGMSASDYDESSGLLAHVR